LDHQLKFHQHSTEATVKANQLLGLIRKSFDHLDSEMLQLTKLFTAFFRPTLEYSNAVWGPFFVLDQRKVEKVQRRATRRGARHAKPRSDPTVKIWDFAGF